MLGEYMYRYGKGHKCMDLFYPLEMAPKNITRGGFTPPPQCMPDSCKDNDVVRAYRNYYIKEKKSFARWKNTHEPKWFSEGIKHAVL